MMHGSYKVYKLQSFEITWRLEFLISLTENDSGYELYSYFKAVHARGLWQVKIWLNKSP